MDEKIESAPSLSSREVASTTLIKPQAREPYDPNVTFEEYHYYAQKTRQEELSLEPPVLNVRQLFRRKDAHGDQSEGPTVTLTEDDFKNRERRLEITDEEWTNASRSIRSASWGACRRNPTSYHPACIKLTACRLLSDYHGHPGTVWVWICDGNIGMGTR